MTADVSAVTATRSPDHAGFLARSHFGSLDGLRALSVIAVIWHHAMPTFDASVPHLLTVGYHGVTLFFAISGFLIVTLLLRERARTGKIDLGAFYIRRGLRIFPLYFATCALYTVLVLLFERNSVPGREFIANLPYFLTFTSNVFVPLEGRVIFYFAWSLAAEEQFYLLWSTLQRYLSPFHALLIVIVLSAFIACAQIGWWASGASAAGLLLRFVFGFPLAICFGVILAYAFHDRRTYDALGVVFGAKAAAPGALVLLLAILSIESSPPVLVHMAAVFLVATCVYREDHGLQQALCVSVLAYVGTVSYGVYLLHMLVKNVILKAAGVAHVELPALLLFALTVVGAVIAATVSFQVFESRFLQLKHRFMTARAPPTSSPVSRP